MQNTFCLNRGALFAILVVSNTTLLLNIQRRIFQLPCYLCSTPYSIKALATHLPLLVNKYFRHLTEVLFTFQFTNLILYRHHSPLSSSLPSSSLSYISLYGPLFHFHHQLCFPSPPFHIIQHTLPSYYTFDLITTSPLTLRLLPFHPFKVTIPNKKRTGSPPLFTNLSLSVNRSSGLQQSTRLPATAPC